MDPWLLNTSMSKRIARAQALLTDPPNLWIPDPKTRQQRRATLEEARLYLIKEWEDSLRKEQHNHNLAELVERLKKGETISFQSETLSSEMSSGDTLK